MGHGGLPQRYPALLADRQLPQFLAHLGAVLAVYDQQFYSAPAYHLGELVGAHLDCVDPVLGPEQQFILGGSVDGQDHAEDLAFVVVFVDAEQFEGFIGEGVVADFEVFPLEKFAHVAGEEGPPP